MRTHVVAVLVSSTLFTAACLTEGNAGDEPGGRIDITPGGGGGKEDGHSFSPVVLTPRSPVAKFTVLCGEWFSCDLEIVLSGAPVGTWVEARTENDASKAQFIVRDVSCIEGSSTITARKLVPLDQDPAPTTQCGEIRVRIHSSNAVEKFDVDVSKDDVVNEIRMRLGLSWW